MKSKKGSTLSKELIEDLLRDYDLKVRKIKPIRNAYRIDTDRGKKLLKKSKNAEEDLLYIHRALEHLARKGFRKVSRFIVNKFGDPYVRNGEELFYLTDWVEGKECKFDNNKWLVEGARMMAELHLASLGYPLNESGFRSNFGQWQGIFANRSKELLQIRSMVKENKYYTQFDQIFLSNIDKYYHITQKSIKLLEQSEYNSLIKGFGEQPGFCHQGFTARNLLRTKNGLILVDFDHLKHDIHLLDLGRFMLRYLPKYDWDIAIANLIINSYNQIYELDKKHLEVLLAYFMYPHRFWRLVHRYYNKESHWSEVAFVKKLEKTLVETKGLWDFIQRFAIDNHIDITYILNSPEEIKDDNSSDKYIERNDGLDLTNYLNEINYEKYTQMELDLDPDDS